MLSIIIPSYEDLLLQKTIDSLLENAEGDIEIIVVFAGYLPKIALKDNQKLRTISFSEHRGMRAAINAGLVESKGDFIMKIDEHCIVGKGFDRILIENCAENWLMIPRRYSLDEENWKRNELRPIQDYHYLSSPQESSYGYGIFVGEWHQKTKERLDSKYDIDDTMIFQGSCWFADKKYFMEHVGFLDDRIETYGSFVGEQHEIGLKYWLGGGAVKVIKKTWYAHLKKTKKYYRKIGWVGKSFKKNREAITNNAWLTKHWMNNEEPNMIYSFSWLVEKFQPIPTWESYDKQLKNKHDTTL